MKTASLGFAVLAFAMIAPRAASAQEASNAGSIPPPSTGLELLQRQPYWGLGKARPFAAAVIEAGFLYVREELDVGWGKPHYAWGGGEVSTSVSAGAITERAGLRVTVPHFELRAGARYVIPFSHYFLAPQDSYGREDVEPITGVRSRYLGFDAEVSASVALGPGAVFGVGGVYAITGVPSGKYVFDESFHTVVAPPSMVRGRLGYLVQLGLDNEFGFGAFAEVIDGPVRGLAVLRAGPVVAAQISDHFDIVGSIAIVLASHDSLGLRGGDISQLGVRYRWATGEPAPWVPWQ